MEDLDKLPAKADLVVSQVPYKEDAVNAKDEKKRKSLLGLGATKWTAPRPSQQQNTLPPQRIPGEGDPIPPPGRLEGAYPHPWVNVPAGGVKAGSHQAIRQDSKASSKKLAPTTIADADGPESPEKAKSAASGSHKLAKTPSVTEGGSKQQQLSKAPSVTEGSKKGTSVVSVKTSSKSKKSGKETEEQ